MYQLQTVLWLLQPGDGDGRGCCTKHLYLPDRDASSAAVASNLCLVILGTADRENVQGKSKLWPKEKHIKPHNVLQFSFSAVLIVSKIF